MLETSENICLLLQDQIGFEVSKSQFTSKPLL